MTALGRPRQRLEEARAAFERTEAATASQWDDSARRSFDARISQPLEAAVRQYAAALAELDAALADCLRLTDG